MDDSVAGSGVPPPPAQAPPPPPAPSSPAVPTPWWKRRMVLVAAGVAAGLGVLGLVIGVVALAASSSTRSDADDAEAEVAEVDAQVAEVETQRDAAQQRLDDLVEATTDVADAAVAFEVTTALVVDAQNALTEVHNEAVDRVNAGAAPEGQDIAREQGPALVDDYETSVDAELEALSDLQTAVNALKEVVDGD